jgi:hypothetical protein
VANEFKQVNGVTRSEYYQQLLRLVASDQGAAEGLIARPSLDDLRSGRVTGAFLDLGDLLPQLSAAEIDRLFSIVAQRRIKFFATASVYYSDTVLEDGLNQHATVESHQWWEALFKRKFEQTDRLASFEDSELPLTNFAVAPATKSRIASIHKGLRIRRELERLANRVRLGGKVLMGGTISQSALLAELDGKTVAVVGNARSLASRRFGDDIDAHDIVVRFNRVPIVTRLSHGYRTDWVATGVPVTQERLTNLGASRLLWLSAYRRKMTRETIAVKQLYLHAVGDIRLLAQQADVERPTTGLMAIDLLSKSKLAAATLYGFDFYHSQSASSHQTIETAPHAFDKEEIYVKGLIGCDRRFQIAGT